jgi:hypothetical protein
MGEASWHVELRENLSGLAPQNDESEKTKASVSLHSCVLALKRPAGDKVARYVVFIS